MNKPPLPLFLLLLLIACQDETTSGAFPDTKPPPDSIDSSQLPDERLTSFDADACQLPGSPPLAALAPCNSGLDLRPFALAQDHCVSFRFTLETSSPVTAIHVDRESFRMFFGAGGGGTPFAGVVREAKLTTPAATNTFFDFTVESSSRVHPSSFLACSPDGQVAVGHTASGTFEGEVRFGRKGTSPPKRIANATGNYDAIFLDERTLLINGLAVGQIQGQGAYWVEEGKPPRLLIKELGRLSGFLVLGEQVVLAGGYFTSGNRLFGFTLAEIKNAIATGGTLTPSQDGDLIHTGNLLDADADGNDLVAIHLDEAWAFQSVFRKSITVEGNRVIAGSSTKLVTLPGTSSPRISRLSCNNGQLALLLQNGSSTELAVIREK